MLTYFCTHFFLHTGYGVYAQKHYFKQEFLLEYPGQLISEKDGEKREKEYPPDKGSFLYFFKDRGKNYCVDATNSKGAGRMVNDSIRPNAVMKIVILDNIPHLCLFALQHISPGEEIRFDYGVPNLPWRKKVSRLFSESS
ncbi:Histone-lysine N-methyltransferase PR-Set7 [Holothuria leucospilota]|uniref:Histone-lysine N-methyltransferase PR-Set7 n=1 Tax=Holothuria leucospilota TaxID=206669 RepID=A0A9Q1CS88_HOLLE|nr:Histone-lysine N-methyltransferase PR-Set7 [Holothuria leucospilota]